MINRKFWLIILILVLAGGYLIYKVVGSDKKLVTPDITSVKIVNPSPEPETPSYNPPPEIKFDSSTDLKKELENINPQVLDSDFE